MRIIRQKIAFFCPSEEKRTENVPVPEKNRLLCRHKQPDFPLPDAHLLSASAFLFKFQYISGFQHMRDGGEWQASHIFFSFSRLKTAAVNFRAVLPECETIFPAMSINFRLTVQA